MYGVGTVDLCVPILHQKVVFLCIYNIIFKYVVGRFGSRELNDRIRAIKSKYIFYIFIAHIIICG